MHFSLPSNLQQEVIGYDKTLKSLTRLEKSKSRAVKYPKGNVISLGLIPENVVKLSDQQEAIDHINRAAAPNAFQLFTKPVLGEDPKPLAVIYYFKQYWIACWMPRDKDADYIYGITVAFRNNATALKQFNNRLFPHDQYDKPPIVENVDQMERTKIGRTEWLHKTLIVNKEMLNKGYRRHYWREVDDNHCLKSYGQMQNIFEAGNRWCGQLFETIPRWTSRYGYLTFDRITDEGSSLYYCMKEGCYWMKPHAFSGNTHDLDTYEHTVDYHLNKIKRLTKTAAFDSTLDRPWFRKYLAAALTETQQRYDKAGHKACMETICQPVNCIAQYLDSLSAIYQIYPDANPDVLQNHYEMFEQVDINVRYTSAIEWIRANVPFDSFINMFKRYFDKQLEEYKSCTYRGPISTTGKYRIFTRDLVDTMAMIDQCIQGSVTDNLKPRRWRLTEWHDHVMKEAWKVKNPNVDLPQKLFPEPIKISYNDTTNYTLLQPRDTHQLSQWGTAVRNCVGTHGYSKGIQQFKHIIVLCMIDKEPRYTIQLTVDNGVMHVSQIADVCNKRLKDSERHEIETVFKTALKLREQQLESA
jgi:hypothetical protein